MFNIKKGESLFGIYLLPPLYPLLLLLLPYGEKFPPYWKPGGIRCLSIYFHGEQSPWIYSRFFFFSAFFLANSIMVHTSFVSEIGEVCCVCVLFVSCGNILINFFSLCLFFFSLSLDPLRGIFVVTRFYKKIGTHTRYTKNGSGIEIDGSGRVCVWCTRV